MDLMDFNIIISGKEGILIACPHCKTMMGLKIPQSQTRCRECSKMLNNLNILSGTKVRVQYESHSGIAMGVGDLKMATPHMVLFMTGLAFVKSGETLKCKLIGAPFFTEFAAKVTSTKEGKNSMMLILADITVAPPKFASMVGDIVKNNI